jgi:hypothetical protein
MHGKHHDDKEDKFWGMVWSTAIVTVLGGLTLLVWMLMRSAT